MRPWIKSPSLVRFAGWVLVPGAVLLAWQLHALRSANPFIFPLLQDILCVLLRPGRDILGQGSLLGNTLISLLRVSAGFSVAAVVAIVLGIAMGSFPLLRRVFEPLIEWVRPLCPVAWIPFAMAAFGRTTLPNVLGLGWTGTVADDIQIGMLFVISWGAFFPVLVNTIDGVRGIRSNYLRLARTLGAGAFQTFLHVNLPAALPMILTGLRQGVSTAWFVIVAAEMLPGSPRGIGYLLMHAGDETGNMEVVIACMVVIGLVGAAFNYGLVFFMKRLMRWHGHEV